MINPCIDSDCDDNVTKSTDDDIALADVAIDVLHALVLCAHADNAAHHVHDTSLVHASCVVFLHDAVIVSGPNTANNIVTSDRAPHNTCCAQRRAARHETDVERVRVE
jgi:hypothetical protein